MNDVELGSVKLVEMDRYDFLLNVTKRAMTHAYENFFDDLDWFFKADVCYFRQYAANTVRSKNLFRNISF